jgi:hypothetical protein
VASIDHYFLAYRFLGGQAMDLRHSHDETHLFNMQLLPMLDTTLHLFLCNNPIATLIDNWDKIFRPAPSERPSSELETTYFKPKATLFQATPDQ